MNHPLAALAAAHHHYVCGPTGRRPAREDVVVARTLIRLLDEQGYRVTAKPPSCPHCGEDLDDFTGTCPTCELTRDRHGLTLDQAHEVGELIRRFRVTEEQAVELICPEATS
jgi:hypothetical protein